MTIPETRARLGASDDLRFLSGGELGSLVQSLDWDTTPLGPLAAWPQSLRSALSICLHSRFPTAIYWGPELRLLYNDAWAPIPAERHPWALGRPAAEVWADIWPVIAPQFQQVIATGEGFSTFDQYLPMIRDGRVCDTYWNYSFTPIRGEDGGVAGVFNQGHEITDRVLDERRDRFLLELSDRLRGLSDPQAIISAAQEGLGRLLGANRVGYGEVDEEARYFTTNRNWTDETVPGREGTHDLAGFGPEIWAALRAGEPLLITDVRTDPRTSSAEIQRAFEAIDTRAALTGSLVKNGRMKAALYVHASKPRSWTQRDALLVTTIAERTWAAVERARAEAAVRASEAFARSILDSSSDCIKTLDLEGRLLSMNGPGRQLMAVEDFEKFRARHWGSMWPAEEQENIRRVLGEARAGRTGRFVGFCPTAAGEPRCWDVAVTAIVGDDGTPANLLVVSRDITDQQRAKDALNESEGRFRELVECAPEKMWVNEPDGTVAYFNRAWREFTGDRRKSQSGSWRDAIHADDRDYLIKRRTAAVASGEAYEVDVRIRRAKDGEWRWHVGRVAPVSRDGKIFAWVGMAADIHDVRLAQHALSELNATLENRVIERTVELEEAHEQLRQSQKLEALGQLTGGLAHDLNNMLTIITGNMDMAHRNLSAGDEPRVHRSIANALKGAESAAALTRRLLAFARRQPLAPRTVDAGDLIDGMSELLARALGETVTLRIMSAPDRHRINVDPHQLENALLNLAVNARDAMPDGGTLTVTTSNTMIEGAAAKKLEVDPGAYVEVAVADTGGGMPEEIAARIFEPFFTTKEQGRGTGLGLSMVHGFAKQSGGTVGVVSRPGEGTVVRLLFPAALHIDSAETPGGTTCAPERPGSGRILLVEDQDEVGDLAESILVDAGYFVLRAGTGDEALQCLEQGAQIDLLFSDVVMPGTLSGLGLAREAVRRQPGVKVLLTSGYSAETLKRDGEFNILNKPYRRGDLLERVRQVLELDPAAASPR